jgi:aspartate-semialdehyde dehydrogenase
MTTSERGEHPRVTVVGATGLVGRELLSILGEHPLGKGKVRVLASSRSAGETVEFRGRELAVEALTRETLAGADLVFHCASGDVSREYSPIAVAGGATVIDNSSAFRRDPTVPLVIPEVNGHVLDDLAGPAIIANPNCSTIIALMAVTPLHRAVGIERMVVSTYQAASGAGLAFLEELEQQARDHVAGQDYTQAVVGRQYIFNLFSHDSPIGPDGANEEECKLVDETHKMWADDSVKISATCVRVPVLRAHSESINLT